MSISEESQHTTLPKPRRRVRAFVSLVLGLVILLGGVVLGIGLTLKFIENRIETARAHPEELPERIVTRMQRRLDLTGEQAERIQTLIAAHRQKTLPMLQRFYPEFLDELDTLRENIAAELDPQQAQQFEKRFEMLKQFTLTDVPLDNNRDERQPE